MIAAAISWFVANLENDHTETVLCLDRGRNIFYVDACKEALIVFVGADGREVARREEAVNRGYRVDLHENAIMAFGE